MFLMTHISFVGRYPRREAPKLKSTPATATFVFIDGLPPPPPLLLLLLLLLTMS
jgi:hypothetical protein